VNVCVVEAEWDGSRFLWDHNLHTKAVDNMVDLHKILEEEHAIQSPDINALRAAKLQKMHG
jgi:hypothetical protein